MKRLPQTEGERLRNIRRVLARAIADELGKQPALLRDVAVVMGETGLNALPTIAQAGALGIAEFMRDLVERSREGLAEAQGAAVDHAVNAERPSLLQRIRARFGAG